MKYSCMQVADKGMDTLHLDLNAQNHPDMPIVGYRVQYKEEGQDWSKAQIADFKKGLSLSCEDKIISIYVK